MIHRLPLCFLLGLLVAGCSNNADDSSTDSTSSSSSSSASSATAPTTGAECSPGLEGCPCYDGSLCIVGLECLSKLCVDPGDASTGDATGDGEGSTDASGTTSFEPTLCESNDDCSSVDVCFDGKCGFANYYDYIAILTEFSPPDCSDGFGTAEVIYKLYLDSALAFSSPEAACPASWPDEWPQFGGFQTFQIDFWEADGIDDDYFTGLCWYDDGEEECGIIPAEILHNGGYKGLTGDGLYHFELVLYVVSPSF